MTLPLCVCRLLRLWALASTLLPASAYAAAPAPRPVQIRFAARVNGAPFACTRTYSDVGLTHATYAPQDFRMYISDVTLVRAGGEQVPVTLVEDGTWQRSNVALIDFEDGRGTCQNGTSETHTTLEGRVPSYTDFVGLHFSLSVPFALDHQDASAAEPPFDQAGLFWGWQAGYKFLTLDGRVDGQYGHSVHVASTGCQMPQPGHVTQCRAPNEAHVVLPKFDAAKNVVIADIGRLLAQAHLTPSPRPAGPPGAVRSHMALPNGCMSEPYNSNCAPVFEALGLPFADAAQPSGTQRFFSVD
jgi:uncharacterized repeat protein (TIGR04052 family)